MSNSRAIGYCYLIARLTLGVYSATGRRAVIRLAASPKGRFDRSFDTRRLLVEQSASFYTSGIATKRQQQVCSATARIYKGAVLSTRRSIQLLPLWSITVCLLLRSPAMQVLPSMLLLQLPFVCAPGLLISVVHM